MQKNLEALQKELGVPLFLVGGMVRDTLLGKKPKDWDLTAPMDPNVMFDLLGAAGYRVLPTGLQHGTISIIFEEGVVEITAHRFEGEYLDGRRPSEVSYEGVTLEQDLSRRDFTINAMAMDLGGEIQDPFLGREDLKSKLIKAVGDPLKRFTEDGLRPMRACRFMSQLDFRVDPRTAGAIPLTLHIFNKVARERILVEFNKLLAGKNPLPALRLMCYTGLLATWIPEFLGSEEILPNRIRECKTLLARQVVFFKPISKRKDFKEILERCKFSSREISRILGLGDLYVPFEYGDVNTMHYHLRQILCKLEEKDITPEEWLDLPHHGALENRLHQEMATKPALHIRDLQISGMDLQRLRPDLKPGPWMSKLLKELQDLVLRKPASNTPQILAEYVKAWES